MSATHPANANAAARESSCPGTSSGDCRYCQRPKGIPILPVRYSVCRIEDNPNLRALPDDRVSAFTQIGLDKQTVDGVEQTKAPVNQYILRRLRQGYLYVYDEGNGDWYGFAVASTGELQQFPVAEPPDEPPGDFACVHEGHSDKASFFTLTNAESVTRVFIAYTEHAWPRAHLREKGNDAAWREQHMQCLDASAWVASQQARHAFPKEAIEQYLPELGESEAVYQASCHYSGVGSSRVAQCDGAPQLVRCMVERTGSLPESVPLMFAVNDEAGIIEELNAYRHEPAQRMQDFLEQGDNARKVLWLSARERLKNGFEASNAERRQQIEESTAPRIERENDEARRITEARHRNFQRAIDNAESEAERARLREERDQYDALYADGYSQLKGGEWERQNQLARLERHSDKLEDEFEGLYRDEADGFESDYVDLRDLCSEQTKRFDADYARWVDQHLERCVSRYSDSDLHHGIGASSIIADTLQGGILGEDSLALWRRLVELDDKNALLIRAFAANLASLGEQLLEAIRDVDTEQDALDRMTLGNWFSLYNLARTSSVNFRDVDTTRRTMANAWRNLQNVVSDVSVALGMRDQALSRGSAQTQPVPMIRLGRLLQIGAMGDPDAPDWKSRASYLVELDIEVGDYREIVRYVAENSGEPKLTKNDAYQFVDPEIDTPNRSGNFASVAGEDTARVRILWQLRETDLDHLAGYLDCERVRESGSFLHARVEDGMARELARQKVSAMKSANPALTGMARLFLVMGVIGALRSANANDWQPESWWKLLSPTLAVASLGAGMASGRYERRAARQGIAAANQSLETAKRLARFGQITGAVGNVIGVIDAFSMLADAEKAERQGELSQFT
uniref:T6SS effector BTH_I2691 family protein n=1 Tax=Salinicola aestuarinus TaxID=1949082 RepID=UPI001CB6FE62